jgi:hypothetical protein
MDLAAPPLFLGPAPPTIWRGRYDPGLAQMAHLHPRKGLLRDLLRDSGGFARPAFRCAPVGLLRTHSSSLGQ